MFEELLQVFGAILNDTRKKTKQKKTRVEEMFDVHRSIYVVAVAAAILACFGKGRVWGGKTGSICHLAFSPLFDSIWGFHDAQMLGKQHEKCHCHTPFLCARPEVLAKLGLQSSVPIC